MKKMIVTILLISLFLCCRGMNVLASSINDAIFIREENEIKSTKSYTIRNSTDSEIETNEDEDLYEVYEEDMTGNFEEEPEEDIIENEEIENQEINGKVAKENIANENEEIDNEIKNEDINNSFNDAINNDIENYNNNEEENAKKDDLTNYDNINTPSEIEKNFDGIEEIVEIIDEIIDTPSEIVDKTLFRAGTPICKVGTTEFSTLEEAVLAIKNGTVAGDIVFIADLEITDITEYQEIDISIDVNIDFNNNKLKVTSVMPKIEDGKGIITKKGTGKLYVKNMIVETYYNALQGDIEDTVMFYVNEGEIKFEDVKYETIDISLYTQTNTPQHNFVTIQNNSNVIITGNNTIFNLIKDWSSYGYCLFNIAKINEGELEIEKGIYKANYLVDHDNARTSSSSPIKLHIENGTIEVKGSLISGNYDTDLQIDDGIFVCNSNNCISVMNATPTSKAIINNGNFTIDESILSTYPPGNPLCLELRDGKYQYDELGRTMFGYTQPQNIKIIGGEYYSTKVDGTTFTIDDAKEEINKSLAFRSTIVSATSPYQWKVVPPTPICEVGTNKYLTLQDAVNDIESGLVSGDIKILRDFEISTTSDLLLVDSSSDINIDFNNKKALIKILIPKVEDGKGIFTKRGSGNLYIKNIILETVWLATQGVDDNINIFYVDGGSLKLENIKYDNIDISAYSGTGYSVPRQDFIVIRNNAKVILTGNETNIDMVKDWIMYSTPTYCFFKFVNIDKGTLEIEDGTYEARNFINQEGMTRTGLTKVIIKDGTFNTKNEFVLLTQNFDIEIESGNFTCASGLFLFKNIASTAKTKIKNGVFDVNGSLVQTNTVASIKVEIDNGNYKYNTIFGWAATHQNVIIKEGNFFNKSVNGTTFTLDNAKEEIQKCIGFRYTVEPATSPYQWKVMPPVPMCKVGTTEFLTFEDAINAIKDGSATGDIIVTRDFEISTNSDIQEIDINIDVNIDFNNKKMKITSVMPVINNSKGVITKKGTGKLYIKNMIVETYYNALQNYGYGNDTSVFYSAGGEIKFENVKYETIDTTQCTANYPTHYFLIVRNNSKIIITGDNTKIDITKENTASPGSYYDFNIAKLGEGNIEIEKGIYKASSVIRSEDAAIRSASSGVSKIYIKDGIFEAKENLLSTNYFVDIQIDNGTYNCKNYILSVYYPTSTSKAVINNGIFVTENAIYDMFSPSGSFRLCLEVKDGKYEYLELKGMYSSTHPEDIKFLGGQYKSTKVDGTTYTLEDAKEDIRNSLEVKYVIEPASAPYQWKVLPPPVLCRIGSTDYISLKDAVDDVTANQTIDVVKDINIDDDTEFINVPASKNFDFTINFNNKTLTIATQSNANGYFIKNNSGKLNINNAKINYINNTTLDSVIFSLQNGELVFQNIIFKCLATTVNTGFVNINGGVLTISGNSTEIDESVGISNYIYKVNNNATINMTGGKYYGGILVSNQSSVPITLNMNNCNVNLMKNSSSVGNLILNDTASHIISINDGIYIYQTFLNADRTLDYPTNTNIKIFNGKFKDIRYDLNNETECTEIITKMNAYALNADATGALEAKRNGDYIEIGIPYVPPIQPHYSSGGSGGGGGETTIPVYDDMGNIIRPGNIYPQDIISENNNVKYDWVKDSNGNWELSVSVDNIKRKCAGELVEIVSYVNNQKVVDKYLFTLDGKMFTGWFAGENNIMYYFSTDNNDIGKMVRGWRLIDNSYYYFNQDGIMLRNVMTPDGYWVDNIGKWIKVP